LAPCLRQPLAGDRAPVEFQHVCSITARIPHCIAGLARLLASMPSCTTWQQILALLDTVDQVQRLRVPQDDNITWLEFQARRLQHMRQRIHFVKKYPGRMLHRCSLLPLERKQELMQVLLEMQHIPAKEALAPYLRESPEVPLPGVEMLPPSQQISDTTLRRVRRPQACPLGQQWPHMCPTTCTSDRSHAHCLASAQGDIAATTAASGAATYEVSGEGSDEEPAPRSVAAGGAIPTMFCTTEDSPPQQPAPNILIHIPDSPVRDAGQDAPRPVHRGAAKMQMKRPAAAAAPDGQLKVRITNGKTPLRTYLQAWVGQKWQQVLTVTQKQHVQHAAIVRHVGDKLAKGEETLEAVRARKREGMLAEWQ